VLRVPTDVGDHYFKATSPELAYEPALTAALAQWRPDCIAPMLAIDAERGWMLMPDGAPTLRSVIAAERDIWRWEQVLPLYAGLQIDMIERRDDLLALGALDRRLAGLPAQFERLLEVTPSLLIDQTDGLTSEEYGRLRGLVPQFAAMCAELASYNIPETLHHDDFHDGNIFAHGDQYLFFDWGETCVAHPFFTLVVGLRGIAYRFELEENDRAIERLRDSYLEPWTAFAEHEQLLAASRLARQVGAVNRALTWYRVVSKLDSPDREEQADAVPGWLQEFLSALDSR
jgi:hypothetical protein